MQHTPPQGPKAIHARHTHETPQRIGVREKTSSIERIKSD
jgi:hypothetical protein